MYKLGIDVGGTNLKAGLTDETGRLLAAARRPHGLPGGGGPLRRTWRIWRRRCSPPPERRRDAEGVLVQLPPVAPAVVGGLIGGQGGKRLRQWVQQGRVQTAKDGPGDGDVLHRRVGQGAVVVPREWL